MFEKMTSPQKDKMALFIVAVERVWPQLACVGWHCNWKIPSCADYLVVLTVLLPLLYNCLSRQLKSPQRTWSACEECEMGPTENLDNTQGNVLSLKM